MSPKPKLKFFERLLVFLLRNMRFGCLRIEFPEGRFAVVGDASFPVQVLKIEDARFYKCVLRGGSIGFGEAYVDGFWSTPDLSNLLLLLAKNQSKSSCLHRGFSFLARFYNRLYHLARRNTLKGSQQNIREHYDLSNDFYRCFLDPTMTYSSGLFLNKSDSLEQAQFNKIDRMLDLANVNAGD